MSRQLHELFLASCGVFGQWGLRIVRTEPAFEERTFSAPYAFVGSRPASCLRLEDPEISRRHAYLQVLPGGLFCLDLGSRAGVCWDDENRQTGWVGRGQRVRIGPYEIALLTANQDNWLAPSTWPHANPLADRISAAGPLPAFIVEVVEDGKMVAKGRMNRVLGLVGRSPDCLFHINSDDLSKFHCSLVRTPTGLWVVDLLSRTGTILNGRRIRCARIQVGDCVEVGKFSLLFRHPRRGAKVSSDVAAATADVRKPEDAGSTIVVQPPSEDMTAFAAPASETSTALEPAPRPPAETAAIARRAAPTMLALPQERFGPEWSMLIALVNQFSLMQQQMFDQFQENMLMTTRMFSSMQKDQTGLVRDELDQLRALASELSTLQGTLNGQSATATSGPHAAGRNGTPVNHNPTPPPANALGCVATPKRAAPSPAAPGPAILPGKTSPADGATAECPPPTQTPEELHAWLNQRISSLQEERQTRWNKLLGMLLGT